MKNYSQGMHKINLWSCLASISLFVALSVLIASIGEVLSGYNFGIFNYVFLILLVLNFLSAIVFGILAAIKSSKRKRIANIIISSISFVGLSAALIPTIILIKIGIDFKNDEERYEQKLKEKYGTVQHYLENFQETDRNIVVTKKYGDGNKSKAYYDKNGEFYNLLYNVDAIEIQSPPPADNRNHPDYNYLAYRVPFDDYSNLSLDSDGFLHILVGPDFHGSYYFYFKIDEHIAKNIIQRADEVLSEYYNQSIS